MQAAIVPHASPKKSRGPADCAYSTPEPFVDADAAAQFLSLTRRRILDLARAGQLPSHSIGTGARRVWRFRLSELSDAIASRHNSVAMSELMPSRITTKAARRAID
jgi:hypothetical protein